MSDFVYHSTQGRLRYDADLTSLSGPPTAHLYCPIVVSQSGKRHLFKAIKDTGAPQTIISSRLATAMGLTISPTQNTYGVIGDKELKRFIGEARDVRIQLAERVEITHNIMVSDDRYAIFLMGNDIFNKAKVQTLHYNDTEGIATIRFGDQIDVMQFTLLSPEESQAHRLPSVPEIGTSAPTSYE